MRYDVWAGSREKAQPEGGLLILRTPPNPTRYGLMIWTKRAKNPSANYSFKTAEDREEYIKKQIEAHEKRNADKMLRAAARKGSPEDIEKITPGTIFHYSWGYEQTNCDYFQVIERKGRYITLRKIGSEHDHECGNSMAEYRKPVPDAFLENAKPMRKLVQFSGGKPYIKINSFGWCNVWDGSANYCSWYA